MMPSMAFADIGGTGTEADPYTINSLEDLKEFRDNVNGGDRYTGKYVKLTANITIDELDWTPIGNGRRLSSVATGNGFEGTFDGGGNTISGLAISSTQGADYGVGLFGVLDGGTVKDLNLENVDINVAASDCAGGAVGLMVNDAKAENITVSGSIFANQGTGGIAGRMIKSGTISNCENNAAINTTSYNVGGIVGAAYYTAEGKEMTISGCVNNGIVNGNSTGVGGIVGLSAANVSNCENNADITGNGADVAGIVAEQQNYGSVTGCINNGTITNNNSGAYGTGGIIGWVRYNGASSSYPVKEIIEVTDNVNNGNIVGGNDGGGIIGTVYNTAIVEGNENNAETISGTTFAGGIVGNIQYNEKPVQGTNGVEIPEKDVNIHNNVSATEKDKITAKCVGEYAYNNDNSPVSGEDVYDNAKKWAASVNGDKYTVLDNALKQLKDGDTLTVFNVEEGQSDITVPEGVKVENQTGNTMNVNGEAVADGETYGESGEQPEEPSEDDPQQPSTEGSQEGETEPAGGSSAQTGDDFNMTALIAIMVIAAAAAAGIVAYDRKRKA